MVTSSIALGVLQSAIALAGLLLVFLGFLITRAEKTSHRVSRWKIKAVALCGLIPFLTAIICALQSIWAIQAYPFSSLHLLTTMKVLLVLTGLYAVLATLLELE